MNKIKEFLEDNELTGKSKAELLPLDKLEDIVIQFNIKNSQWKDLYRLINGGHPEKGYYIFEDGGDFLINNFLNLGNGESDLESALKVKNMLFRGIDFFPLARDGGGNLLLIRENDDDLSVYVWYNDTRNAPKPIASSILELLGNLSEFPEDDDY